MKFKIKDLGGFRILSAFLLGMVFMEIWANIDRIGVFGALLVIAILMALLFLADGLDSEKF